MISVIFSGKIVMAMHIVTLEIQRQEDDPIKGKVKISLSNGLVLEETFETQDQELLIVKKFRFVDEGNK